MATMTSRGLGLITLACVLFVATPASHVPTVPLPVVSPSASPTPAPTPTAEKKPNAVRRFFSWVKDGVTRPFRRRDPVIHDFFFHLSVTTSSSSIAFCPTKPDCNSTREIKLTAAASVPNEQELKFTWMVTGGRLRLSEGREVIWDLSGVAEGTYTATVEVDDGNYHTAASSTSVDIKLCDVCDPPPPLCPSVRVSCPSASELKRELTFVANVAGGDPDLKPAFTWSLTAGKIISGQGTSKITVDASDLPRSQSITATVALGNYHPACTVETASCTIFYDDETTSLTLPMRPGK